MRILSQDGRIDIPYEMVGINIWGKEDPKRKAFCVYAHSNSLNMREGVMALYSSQEKAEKAMEMLRKAYAGLPIIMQNVDITDDVAEMLKEWKKQGIVYRTENDAPSKIELVNNGYFQFPADDEIEV